MEASAAAGAAGMLRRGAIHVLAAMAAVAALAGTACSTTGGLAVPDIGILSASGVPMSREQALAMLRGADHVLLGEVHDNPLHHRERAALLAALADRRPAVVFEQFPRTADVALATPVGADLDAWVARAGFDRIGWGWPLHRPLVEAALANGLLLRGGNLARDEVRQIAREGASAAPADLRDALAQPLPARAAEALDRALLDGHCAQLPAAALPRMRDAQTARDAALADALLRAAAGGAPTVLIAGNGHVRRDHGVPLWLARRQPAGRVVSVGFLERDAGGGAPRAEERAPYDIVWVTARQARPDPCAAFPRAPAGAGTGGGTSGTTPQTGD
jgi:uncharacterized iron-regulated protein